MASIMGDRGDETLDFGQSSSVTISTASATPTPAPNMEYGWVIPVIVGAICLFIISLCITWFALYSRRRSKRYHLQNYNTHYREQSFDEWARNSLRSAEKSHREREREREPAKKSTTCHSICRPPDYRPRLGMIRESPEDRLADLKAKGHVVHTEEKLFSPEDSVFGKNQELSAVSMVSAQLPYYASPGYYPNSAHSHPNLMVSAQAPFSPYRLTWISPSTTMDPRVVRSDPNIVESSFVPCQPHSISSSLCGASYYQSNSCVKSPYNPNHNTPISSDGDSNKGGIPANAVINQSWANNSIRPVDSNSSSAQASPHKGCDEKKDESPIKSMSAHASRGQQTGNDLPCCDSRCEMVMWSYMAPPYPLDTSHVPPPVYTRAMQQDHHLRNSGCEQCQACIISDQSSMNPDIGSSSASVCHNYGHCNNSGPYPYSNNTSVCGHMDSMELTHFSNITGQHSYNASGYNAGPSHSTSIAGHMSSHMTSRDGSVSSRDGSKSSGPVSKGSCPGDSVHSVMPHDTTASDLTSGDTSRTTTNSGSQRLSTTIHSTRSAPAAIGNHNNSTWADSNTDSVNMDGTGPEQHHIGRLNIAPVSLAPIQLPSVVENSIVSHSIASASLPSSRYTPEHLCHTHMAVDVPQDVMTPDAEWDTFPFYTPMSVASNGTSRHTTPDSLAEYGPHLHLMYTAQPVLRDAQYWV